MRFLFWNTHNNSSINSILVDLILEHQIDYIVLAEYSDDVSDLCFKTSSRSGVLYRASLKMGCNRIQIISNLDYCDNEPGIDGDYFSSHILKNRLIVVSVHLPSKLYADEGVSACVTRDIINQINVMEKDNEIDNTIVVGDLNCNPYESVCVAADTFHGIPIYTESKRLKRKIRGLSFKMFYNPMWRFFGDNEMPYGTYYFASKDSTVCPYWNIFDQVLLRPQTKPMFIEDSLKIITSVCGKSFLDKKGHPDIGISDHLPIIFEVEV